MPDNADFGDIEPEDAWDADDPIVEQLHNLRRRVIAILAADALPERAARRLAMIRDDLLHIRERIVGRS